MNYFVKIFDSEDKFNPVHVSRFPYLRSCLAGAYVVSTRKHVSRSEVFQDDTFICSFENGVIDFGCIDYVEADF